MGKRQSKPKYRPYSVGAYRLQWYVDQFAARWDEDGKRRRFRLGEVTEEPARSALHAFVRHRERNAVAEDDTLARLAQAYIADRAEEGRRVEKMHFVWRVLTPTFGALRPQDVTREICKAHIEARRNLGRLDNTINTEMRMLRSILNWAGRMQIIDSVPYVWVPAPAPPRDRHLTRAEVERLLDACELPHIRLFVILAIATAARMQALLGLTWDRIDFRRGLIDLRDPSMPRSSKGRALVPMNDTARAALLEAKAGALSDYAIEWTAKRVGNIKHGMSNALKRAGIKTKGDGAHLLRHTAAVWMAEDGVPMSEIAQYLGHSRSEITERVYARFSPQYLRKAAGSLNLTPARRFA